MLKKHLFCVALLLAGAAHADELADANALFDKKAYPQALQLYAKLANAGNADAQQHLAAMYWYGEAGAVDEAKAEAWFRKSAAKGNKVAIASLGVMKQRVERRADIDYWVAKYDGSELRSGQLRCPLPRFPSVSKQNDEIDRVTNNMKVWQDCHNRFVANLNQATPLIERIPPDIGKLMNKDEMERATAHMEQVQANLAEDARVGSKLVLADFDVWRSATTAYVNEHNDMVRQAPSAGASKRQ